MSAKRTYFVLKLESYEGEDTYLRCGDDRGQQGFLFCIVVMDSDGTAEVVDSGYRSEDEARRAWPDAVRPLKREDRRRRK